jgi:hypothetical protein
LKSSTDLDVLKTVTVEQVLTSLNGWGRSHPDSQRLFIEAFSVALNGEKPDDAMLHAVREILERGPPGVGELGGLVAKTIISTHPEWISLVKMLSESSRAQGRIAAILCLPSVASSEAASNVIGSLVKDRSRRVKELAIDWIGRNRRADMMFILEAAFQEENDPSIKKYLRKEIDLLRNGFLVTREGGATFVTILTDDGRVSGYVNFAQIGDLSDQEIVMRYRANLRSG